MNLNQKIAKKMKSEKIGRLSEVDTRNWARHPKSQKAVDLAIEGKLFEEIADARKAGYVIGDRWVPPQQRGKLT